MSADFWAGYVSGAVGIIIGNPLDIIKVQLQRSSLASETTITTTAAEASSASASATALAPTSPSFRFTDIASLQALKGTAAPILGYGALNALMFMTYNRSMHLFSQDPARPTSLSKTWLSGAIAGLATFVVSAPTELVKCRAQVSRHHSSWDIARQLWAEAGLRGLYWGGAVTSVRDSVGYGFYFWSYELSKRVLTDSEKKDKPEWVSVLLCGGIAGVVTWASVFPLDVVKTRLQTQNITAVSQLTTPSDQSTLLSSAQPRRLNSLQIAQQAYRNEGWTVFFRGLGVCSVRAFFVNAVQWAVYEWMMHILLNPISTKAS